MTASSNALTKRQTLVAKPSEKIRIYDNTMLMAAQTCLRLYYLKHIRHFRTQEEKIWFTFGRGWHAAMDIIWPTLAKNNRFPQNKLVDLCFEAFCKEWIAGGYPDPDQMGPEDFEEFKQRTPWTAMEMFHFYIEKRQAIFRNPSLRLLSVEEPFAVPISGSNHKIFYTGRWDKTIQLDGVIRCIEHKTTSSFRSPNKINMDYLESYALNNQVGGYNYSARFKHGQKFRGVWVDVALVHKDVHNVFELLPFEYSKIMLDNWLWDTWYWIAQIEGNREALKILPKEAPYMAAFPHTWNSCYRFPFLCEMFDTCRFNTNPRIIGPPEKMKIEKWEPFDLLQLQKLGLRKENTE